MRKCTVDLQCPQTSGLNQLYLSHPALLNLGLNPSNQLYLSHPALPNPGPNLSALLNPNPFDRWRHLRFFANLMTKGWGPNSLRYSLQHYLLTRLSALQHCPLTRLSALLR